MNTLLNQPKIESFVENASVLIKECVAETGGCRVSLAYANTRATTGKALVKRYVLRYALPRN